MINRPKDNISAVLSLVCGLHLLAGMAVDLTLSSSNMKRPDTFGNISLTKTSLKKYLKEK